MLTSVQARIFGLTGGIATGKSSVANFFRSWGVPVVDADGVAREVVAKDTAGLAELVAAFGAEILDDSGALDRKALARLAFANPEGRRILGRITHPKIAARSQEHFSAIASRGEPLIAYEASLLVENGLADLFRPLVAVTAPEELQLSRALHRDGDREEDVRSRIAAQMPSAAKAAAADFVIDNRGTLAELERASRTVLLEICRALGVDSTRYALGAAP